MPPTTWTGWPEPSGAAMADGDRWCVIGAGPSGLAALKNLLAAGIDAECLEREDGVGGNWNYGAASSRVFASTRLISSKSLTAFRDYPMPRHWPHYPDHHQCLEYLRGYARHFGLGAHVRHGAVVERVAPAAGSGWVVHCAGHDARRYAGVVIASGHNHVPRHPAGTDAFAGPVLHAADYKSPTHPVPLAGRRVLVVGAGNSGCDIAVECARHAALTVLSSRRGYHVVPREIRGRPADLRAERLLALGLPVWLRRIISLRVMHRAIGRPERHGLARPDHRLWETHPIVNSDLLASLAAGTIVPAAAVERFTDRGALFEDGSMREFDVVICATGYRAALPFIDGRLLGAAGAEGLPRLYMSLLHRRRDDVAVVGLIQPDSGQWGITDLQSRLVAGMAVAARRVPAAAAWLYAARQRPAPRPPIRYVDSPRHALEVEHFAYRRRLERLVDSLERRLRRGTSRYVSRMSRVRPRPS